jgi:transcriptional regulator of arginine metabolism
MNDKHRRLALIKDLLSKNRFSSQEEVLAHLERIGMNVTQATLSRDLKDLGVGKVADGDGGYIYALPGEALNQSKQEAFTRDFLRGFLSMDFSANMALIRTLGGHANSVALALDNLEIPELLGTVAGDDTIIAILKEGAKRIDFLKSLDLTIPHWSGKGERGE